MQVRTCTHIWHISPRLPYIVLVLTGLGKNNIQICVDNGKIVEISGQYNNQLDTRKKKDWRSGQWWEQGYVRRLELPEDADWRRIQASVSNDTHLELKIPKRQKDSDAACQSDHTKE